ENRTLVENASVRAACTLYKIYELIRAARRAELASGRSSRPALTSRRIRGASVSGRFSAKPRDLDPSPGSGNHLFPHRQEVQRDPRAVSQDRFRVDRGAVAAERAPVEGDGDFAVLESPLRGWVQGIPSSSSIVPITPCGPRGPV